MAPISLAFSGKVKFKQPNPKNAGSQARARYAKYSKADTLLMARGSGALMKDLKFDIEHKHVVRAKDGPPAVKPEVRSQVKAKVCKSLKRPAGRDSRPQQPTLIRVAMLGDSNTVALAQRRLSIGIQLEQCLGTSFQVRSFGVSGATASGAKCYASSCRFQKALQFDAHIYVVMLGTNDAWHKAGKPDKVAHALRPLLRKVHVLASTASHRDGLQGGWPRVVLVQPPGDHAFARTNLLTIVHPALRQLAAEELYAELVEPTLDGTCYVADKVHLSPKGAAEIAGCVSGVILRD